MADPMQHASPWRDFDSLSEIIAYSNSAHLRHEPSRNHYANWSMKAGSLRNWEIEPFEFNVPFFGPSVFGF